LERKKEKDRRNIEKEESKTERKKERQKRYLDWKKVQFG
jgi:hypothetical protein